MKLLVMWGSARVLALSGVACDRATDSVVGRWERTRGQPASVQFEPDGGFIARVGSDKSLIRGTYTQQGAAVTVTGNYTLTLTLPDSILVAKDGTEYRRVNAQP